MNVLLFTWPVQQTSKKMKTVCAAALAMALVVMAQAASISDSKKLARAKRGYGGIKRPFVSSISTMFHFYLKINVEFPIIRM